MENPRVVKIQDLRMVVSKGNLRVSLRDPKEK